MLTVIKKHLAKQVKCPAYFCKVYLVRTGKFSPNKITPPKDFPPTKPPPGLGSGLWVKVGDNLPRSNFFISSKYFQRVIDVLF